MPTNKKQGNTNTAAKIHPDKRWNTDKLIEYGIETVKELMVLEARRTDLLRALAETLVLLRVKHNDLAGRSAEYRADAARIYEGAGVEADSASNVQAAVRYHIGNVLRETQAPEDVEAAGLSAASPRERARRQPNTPSEEQVTIDLRDMEAIEAVLSVIKVLEAIDPSESNGDLYAVLLELQVVVAALITVAHKRQEAA